MDATAVVFIEFPRLQLHYNPTYDSLYIVGSCRFRVYFFSSSDFTVPLFHPMFDPTVPYFAFPVSVAPPAPPPPAPAAQADPIPASPLHMVPGDPMDAEDDPSEATDSSSSSSGPDDSSPIGPAMANGHLTP